MLTTNLTAYWKLDEASGNAADATGGGKTLTNTGGGTYGAALINNGFDTGASNTSKYLTIADRIGYTGGAVSVNFWFKQKTVSGAGNKRIFELGDNTTSKSAIEVYRNVGTGIVHFNRFKAGVGDQEVTTSHAFSTSAFEMITLTYDGATLEGFINGASIGTVSASGNGSGSLTEEFSLATTAGAVINSGVFDEVGIWSRALTGAEITQLYNAGAGLAYPFAASVTDVNLNRHAIRGVGRGIMRP